MCIICIHLDKDKLTSFEAIRNLGEMVGDKDLSSEEEEHVVELLGKIEEKFNKETK